METREGKVTIYALCEPDGTPRYVGATAKRLAVRLREHLAHAKRNKSAKERWLFALLQAGATPVIRALEATEEREAQTLEEFYITRLRAAGCQLTNTLPGGPRHAVWQDGGADPQVVRTRLPRTLKQRIAQIAHDEERSFSWMTVRLIRRGVQMWEDAHQQRATNASPQCGTTVSEAQTDAGRWR